MATETVMEPIDQCKKCIEEKKSFVLQGGAGSGKTELLKNLLLFINQTNPKAKVMCITHTNVAVDEILSRTGNAFPVSTIHSFLNSLIKDYKKNIYNVIGKLFYLPLKTSVARTEDMSDDDYKRMEYDRYKSIYEKYADMYFYLFRETVEKVKGKREYDKTPKEFDDVLNNGVALINKKIDEEIASKSYTKIKYNETKFDSLKDLTFGHDGLLKIFHELIEHYTLLSKIIASKYDYIFIDEYQDTNAEIVCDFIEMANKSALTIGLFGDSMQSIYSDGVGNVDDYISNPLVSIFKPDNYRCAYEIVKFINPMRIDGLEQDVALKVNQKGEKESKESRHGVVKVLYVVCDQIPTGRSSDEEKKAYQLLIDKLICEAKKHCVNSKILMLTNKAIAEKNEFLNLYKIFSDRYYDVSDRMEKYLSSIQVLEFCDICHNYLKGDYNTLIKSIKNSGFVIKKLSDKKEINDIMTKIVSDKNISMWEAILSANAKKLIKLSDSTIRKIESEKAKVQRNEQEDKYIKFRDLYRSGDKIFSRIKDKMLIESKEVFDELEAEYKEECFIKSLFSKELKFEEALNYSKYLNEETEYITMHKTKGSSIENVIVVMDECFWKEYDFSSLYLSDIDPANKIEINSRKLIYVACSRAISKLICVKVVKSDEVDKFLKKFSNAERVNI